MNLTPLSNFFGTVISVLKGLASGLALFFAFRRGVEKNEKESLKKEVRKKEKEDALREDVDRLSNVAVFDKLRRDYTRDKDR